MNVLIKENSTWAQYDTSEFPLVKVTLKNKIRSDEEFDHFLQEWENLYSKDESFTLYFDTTEVGMVGMKYAFRMRSFIRRLKSDYPRLLEKSYIRVNSKWVKFLLSIMFTMEKPVAPVYVYSGDIQDARMKVYNP